MRPHTFPAADVPDDIGPVLRTARLGRRWSQEMLSRRSGVARETIAVIENSGRRPRSDTLLRLFGALLGGDAALERIDAVPAWPDANPGLVVGHGPRSRERRLELGISLAEASAATGLSQATLSRYERNVASTPSILHATRNGNGDLEHRSRHEGLARLLGFASTTEHDSYCERSGRRLQGGRRSRST